MPINWPKKQNILKKPVNLEAKPVANLQQEVARYTLSIRKGRQKLADDSGQPLLCAAGYFLIMELILSIQGNWNSLMPDCDYTVDKLLSAILSCVMALPFLSPHGSQTGLQSLSFQPLLHLQCSSESTTQSKGESTYKSSFIPII